MLRGRRKKENYNSRSLQRRTLRRNPRMSTEPFLAGKTALVTGASRGIGRGIALALAEAGAEIAVHYARKSAAAQEVVAQVQALGRRACAVKANLAEPAKVDAMLDEVLSSLGACDIFIANAASGVFGSLLQASDKHWDWTMDINARSVLHCAQRLAPSMIARGWGRIVTITSAGGGRVIPSYGMVGLSKAVLDSLTRYLAVELAPHGITVNAISPGLVETGVLDAMPIERAAALEHFRTYSPGHRLVTPEDIGRLAAFLCSDSAALIVGQTITVDGGFSLLSDFFPRQDLRGSSAT
jgi:enoyl-[acyl-carrier protein] reductase III